AILPPGQSLEAGKLEIESADQLPDFLPVSSDSADGFIALRQACYDPIAGEAIKPEECLRHAERSIELTQLKPIPGPLDLVLAEHCTEMDDASERKFHKPVLSFAVNGRFMGVITEARCDYFYHNGIHWTVEDVLNRFYNGGVRALIGMPLYNRERSDESGRPAEYNAAAIKKLYSLLYPKNNQIAGLALKEIYTAWGHDDYLPLMIDSYLRLGLLPETDRDNLLRAYRESVRTGGAKDYTADEFYTGLMQCYSAPVADQNCWMNTVVSRSGESIQIYEKYADGFWIRRMSDSSADTIVDLLGESMRQVLPEEYAQQQDKFQSRWKEAIDQNNAELFVRLASLTAWIDAQADVENEPVLIYAVRKNLESSSADKTEIIEHILRAGVPVNQTHGSNPQSALHLAARNGNISIVRLLVRAGANVALEDADGNTAEDLADENNHEAIVEYLDSVD
ncbi:MAG: ankyrin repeat domain-containing protein, partial [Leptospiraceae bacterium]|nr:ankyrin repeat domain-containing protein [Leptospiraceae bacterium]